MVDYKELMDKAIEVSKSAYVPYSHFPVGACVLTTSGKTYCGCNFENGSYGLTICAERNAIGSAIADGEKKIKAIAIYSPKMNKCMPCGACRQVIAEFAESDTVVLQKIGEEIRPYTINELLPETFVL